MESLRLSHENRVQDYTNWIIFEPVTLRRSLPFVFFEKKILEFFFFLKIIILFLPSQILGLAKVDRTFEIFMLLYIRG